MKRRILAFVVFCTVLSNGLFLVPQKVSADNFSNEFTPEPTIQLVPNSLFTNEIVGSALISGGEFEVTINATHPSVDNTPAAIAQSSFAMLDNVMIDAASSTANLGSRNYLGGFPKRLREFSNSLDPTRATQTIRFNMGQVFPAGQNIALRIRLEPLNTLSYNDILGTTITFTTPATPTQGLGSTQPSTSTQSIPDSDSDSFSDSIACEALSPSTWGGCFVVLFYNLVYKLSALIVTGAGWVMDVLINFSISSFFYRNSSFITSGWTIVRDIANLLFIFALLKAGIETIINGGTAKVKSTIITVVLVALAVNFSLFFTRVIVDFGNVTARIFYSHISVQGHTSAGLIDSSITGINQVNISEGLTQGLNLQKIFSRDTVNLLTLNGGLSATAAFFILVLGVAVNLVAAWAFFFCAFLMIGRIVGLWIAMIFSPLALISKMIKIDKMKDFTFGNWLSNLTSLAFMPTIFLFFVYIIMLFIQSRFLDGLLLTGGTTNVSMFSGEFLKVIIGIILQFAIIITMINRARKLATDLSGDFGKGMASIANMAGGLVIGAATGGVAMLGKQTIGRGAMMASQSEKLKERAAKGGATGWIARQQLATVNNLKDRTFDARNGKVMGYGLKDAFEGAKIKEPAKGGFQTLRNTAMKNKQELAKTLEVSADEPLMKELYEARKGTDKERIKNAEKAIADENKRRKNSYADVVENDPLHRYGKTGASETANSIRKALTKEDIDKDEEKATVKKEKEEKKKRDDDLITVLNNLANKIGGGQNNPPQQQNQSNNAPGNTGGPGAGPTVQFTGGVNFGPGGNTSGQAPIFTRINTGGTQSGQERTPIGFRASAGGGSGGSSSERTPIGFKLGNQSSTTEQKTVNPSSYSVERANVPKPPTAQATNPQPQRNPIGFRKTGPNDEL